LETPSIRNYKFIQRNIDLLLNNNLFFFEMANNFIAKKYKEYLKNEYNKPPPSTKKEDLGAAKQRHKNTTEST
jgi:hypothetical protein